MCHAPYNLTLGVKHFVLFHFSEGWSTISVDHCWSVFWSVKPEEFRQHRGDRFQSTRERAGVRLPALLDTWQIQQIRQVRHGWTSLSGNGKVRNVDLWADRNVAENPMHIYRFDEILLLYWWCFSTCFSDIHSLLSTLLAFHLYLFPMFPHLWHLVSMWASCHRTKGFWGSCEVVIPYPIRLQHMPTTRR